MWADTHKNDAHLPVAKSWLTTNPQKTKRKQYTPYTLSSSCPSLFFFHSSCVEKWRSDRTGMILMMPSHHGSNDASHLALVCNYVTSIGKALSRFFLPCYGSSSAVSNENVCLPCPCVLLIAESNLATSSYSYHPTILPFTTGIVCSQGPSLALWSSHPSPSPVVSPSGMCVCLCRTPFTLLHGPTDRMQCYLYLPSIRLLLLY